MADEDEYGCDRCGSLTCQSRTASATSFGVAVVGARGVGKSAICVQLKTRRFIWEYDSSEEYTYQVKLPLGDHCSSLTIVDTARRTNLEEFDFGGINGILLVFSVTDSESFARIQEIKAEIDAIRHRRPKPLRFLLVGNKRDLIHCRRVTEMQGQELASRLGCEYTEVSARIEGQRIHAAFQVLLHKMRAAKKRRAQRYWTTVVDQVVSGGNKQSSSALPGLGMGSKNSSTLPALGRGNGTSNSTSSAALMSPMLVSVTSPPPPTPNVSVPPRSLVMSSTSCDNLLSPSESQYSGDEATYAINAEGFGLMSITPDPGSTPKRSSLKKSMMKRVSSLRAPGRQSAAGHQRRASKASIDIVVDIS